MHINEVHPAKDKRGLDLISCHLAGFLAGVLYGARNRLHGAVYFYLVRQLPNYLATWRTAAAVAAMLPLGLSASPRLSDADLFVAGLGEHSSQAQTARRL